MKRWIFLVLALALLLSACQNEHQHTWNEATCTEPKTCSSCSETDGNAIGHKWEEATCVVPQTCSVCNATNGEATGHEWEAIDYVMTCKKCGEVDETITVEVPPLHKILVTDGQEEKENYLNIFNQNNVQGNATFLENNGWIYGQAWAEDGSSQFVKVRTDGTDWTVLDDGFAHNIFIVDNYIYYMINKESEPGIYKMKTSGEDKKKIADATGSMQIVGREIYYYDDDYESIETEDGVYEVLPEYCHLYRCDLNGENVTEIIAKPTFFFYVFEDGILYQDDNDKMSLHVCGLDGANDIKLNDALSFFPLYDGEYIYYVRESGSLDAVERCIWKVRPDGTEDQLVAEYAVSRGMVMSYNYIYFVYADDSDRLYRINKDGSNLTLITQDTNVTYPQLFNNFIKYTKRTEDYEYIEANYFCDYDGSGKWDFLDINYQW